MKLSFLEGVHIAHQLTGQSFKIRSYFGADLELQLHLI